MVIRKIQKNMKKLLSLMLAVMLMVSLAACGGKTDVATDFSQSVEGAKIVAEAGSAGEAAIKGESLRLINM